jgi:hypothetical protein
MDLVRAVTLLESGNWDAAHRILQEDDSPLACWGHGVVHIMEGDLDNARYWYRRARRPFPAVVSVADEIAALRLAVARPSMPETG